MKRTIFVGAMALIFVLPGAAADAQNTACFDWDCDHPDVEFCTFDASCTEITDGQIWRYSWDFGDGSSELSGDPVTSHSFDANFSEVTLKVLLFNSNDSPEVTCEINVFNNFGTPLPLTGRCEE